MPMKLNAGLSRKVGEANYGSRGASVNLELELDSSLIQEPAKLQEKIRHLFVLVRAALQEELNGNGHAQPVTDTASQANGTGNGGENVPRTPPRLATQSQVKAIFAIAKSGKLDLKRILQDRFKVAKPEDLGIKEASALIDELKKSSQQNGG